MISTYIINIYKKTINTAVWHQITFGFVNFFRGILSAELIFYFAFLLMLLSNFTNNFISILEYFCTTNLDLENLNLKKNTDIFLDTSESKNFFKSEFQKRWLTALNNRAEFLTQLYLNLVNKTPEGLTILNKNPELSHKVLSICDIIFQNFVTFADIKLLIAELGNCNLYFNLLCGNDLPFITSYKDLLDYQLLSTNDISSKNFANLINTLKQTPLKESVFYNTNHPIIAQQLKDFFLIQLLFIDLASFFINQKILTFMFFNGIIIFLMIWNITRLTTAINLIFALLHFLFFAILGGLLAIYWGATYLGFCILLIYGAAIPVLALYIIMLVNVDLIQRLFFVEHISSKFLVRKLKFLFAIVILLILVVPCFFTSKETVPDYNDPTVVFVEGLSDDIFYFLLMQWFLSNSSFGYATSSPLDIPLSFYTSDIDKVATAAYKTSYNELLALVFLLLIAIIVVISISWPSSNQRYPVSKTLDIDTCYPEYTKLLSTEKILFQLFKNTYQIEFLKKHDSSIVYGGRPNYPFYQHYLYISRADMLPIKNSNDRVHKEYEIWRFLNPSYWPSPNDPWSLWFLTYRSYELYPASFKEVSKVAYYLYGEDNLTYEDTIMHNYYSTFIY